MSLKQRVITKLVWQFGHPRGVTGRVTGWVMAHRESNRQRNTWVVSLLDVRPAERVLEVGFGPGVAIGAVARLATEGHVHGIDHSEVMVRRARRRNLAAVRAGRVDLVHASVERLPPFEAPLDAIYSISSLGFWPDPARRLHDLRRLLRPGGRIALASQPWCPGATRETTANAARELGALLTAAGFAEPRVEILELEPPVACVLATNPG